MSPDADRPPERDSARDQAGTIGTTDNTHSQNTTPAQAAPLYEVRITRNDSRSVVLFNTYADHDEAKAVAGRIRRFGGHAFVVAVTR